MIKTYILILFLLFGCGGRLVRDASLSAFEANFPTAEFRACGDIHHGLAVCMLEKGIDPGLKIQGFHDGAIKISSPNCEIVGPKTFRYEDSSLVSVRLKDQNKSCFIQFVILPEYDTQTDSPIDVYNIKGMIYVRRVSKSSQSFSQAHHIRQFRNRNLSINVGGAEEQARLILLGCDSEFDSQIKIVNGKIVIKTDDFVSSREIKSCIVNGAIITKTRKIRLTFLLNFYDEKYQRLAIPTVSFTKTKIKVKFSPSVSIIALNKKYKIKRESSFKFHKESFNILRGITVKGRTVIGIWYPTKQKFLWRQ
jgi:hypothetical protein